MRQSHLAQQIIRSVTAGSLGTLTEEGNPFVSLVTVAATSPTSVVMLLSGLAKHTQNLTRHADCSLLLVELGGESGDPLAGARLTLTGNATEVPREDDAGVRKAFLEKHPDASLYADFGDFAFYQIDIRQAHLVAGFGQIETLSADRL